MNISSMTKGRGVAELLDVRIQYVARMNRPTSSILGNSWLLTTLPTLVYNDMSGNVPMAVSRVTSLRGTARFARSEDNYVGENGTRQRLTISGTDYVVIAPDGTQTHFYGPSSAPMMRGRLKKIVHANGAESVAAYDGAQRIQSLTASVPGSDHSAALYFQFAAGGYHSGRILFIEKRLSRAGVEQPIKRWSYTYHTGADQNGLLNDLKTASTEEFDETVQAWRLISSNYYRYYKESSDVGFPHGLKYVVSGADYARLKDAGLDPALQPMVSDQTLAGFATSHRTYDPDRRVSKIERYSGKETFQFDRVPAAETVNWDRRSVESRPDGSTLTTYFNSLNQPILRVLAKGGDSWPTWYDYDSDAHLTLEAGPDAISAFTMPTDPYINVSVTLRTDQGLIQGGNITRCREVEQEPRPAF